MEPRGETEQQFLEVVHIDGDDRTLRQARGFQQAAVRAPAEVPQDEDAQRAGLLRAVGRLGLGGNFELDPSGLTVDIFTRCCFQQTVS